MKTANRILAETGPQLVDARELAGRLGVSLATLWTWNATGKLPKALRPSARVVRWNLREIEQWLAAGTPPRDQWEAQRGRRAAV
ncbi:MAG: helix-turn-helix domain-containing protein [Planctomycetota bacterium]